jgi:polysaccharide export outer membrane protein
MSRLLRLLGAITVSLMLSGPSLAANTNIDANYTLRAGDTLHISVWKEDELDRLLLVLPDGTIDFPLIGSVRAAGSTPAQLKDTITEMLKPYIPAATVSVVVRDTLGNTVSVIGQVTHPGDIVMSHALDVMQALSQAGGPTPYADESNIVILRKVGAKQVSLPFNYSDISRGRHLDDNIPLQPGDVIVVPTASLF